MTICNTFGSSPFIVLLYIHHRIVVQLLSCVRPFATPWTAAHQVSLSFTISWSLLKLMSILSVMPYNHLIFCCLLLFLSAILPSMGFFSNESALCIRWPKCWSFSFSISPSNEYLGLISFRIDWFDLLAVQETLKSILQHYNLKVSILRHFPFFKVELSHPYLYWKNHSFDYMDLYGQVMSLLFNMLSRFVIAFLLKSMRRLISWLQSPTAVILEPRKIKSLTVSTYFPSICHEVMGLVLGF